MPSMPSVPLISARPSFSWRVIGCSTTSAASRSVPSASRTGPSPIIASAQCASGARSPEQPSEPYSWTTGVMPGVQHRRVGLRRLDPHARAAGGERREPQQHQRARDLALDLGPAARGVAADQAALELRAPLGRDVQRGERAEAGGHAVVRVGVGGQRLDDRAAARDRLERLRRQLDPRIVPRDRDHLVARRRTDPDRDRRRLEHGAHHITAPRAAARNSPPVLSRI